MSDPMWLDGHMKRTTTRNSRAVKTNAPRSQSKLPDLELLAEVSAGQVEHRTVLEFLRSIPHKWQADDIVRFGDKVKRLAEALQLAFVPVPHPQLGVIRTYPVPLLEWVYTMQAKQLHWPSPVIALEDGRRSQREALRKNEQLAQQIQELMSATDEPPVVEAASVIIQSLSTSIAQAREALEEESAAAADGAATV